MKRFFSALTVIMLTVLVSVFFVSCGDDYKKMYLEVQYWTYSEESEYGVWTAVDTDENSENYGLSFVLNDMYKLDSSEYYSLKMRVVVKGTKKKVDQIYVSCPEGELDKNTVTSGEVFTIKFSSTQSPYLFVTPSIKSDTASERFPIVFYSELDYIEANTEYYPAVVRGGELNLNELTDLIIYHGVDGIETNQKGVRYAIDGVEAVDGVYTLGSGADAISLDTRDNLNKITVGSKFSQNSITLEATSVYEDFINRENEDGLKCLIYLRIVDNVSSESINVNYYKENKYSSTDDSVNNSNEVKTLALYENSDYSQTRLVLSGVANDASLYNFTETSGVAYKVKVLIYESATGKFVDLEEKNWRYEGIEIYEVKEEASEKQKVYNIQIIEQSGITENLIRFVVGFDNLKFTGKDYSLENSVLTYDLKIERNDLPKSIYINGNSYQDGQELEGVIYDKYVTGKGFELNINAVRSYQKETEIIMSVTSEDDAVYSEEYHPVVAYNFNNSVLSGNVLKELSNKIYLRFNEETGKTYPSEVNVVFKVLTSPLEFEGETVTNKEYINVTLRLKVSGSLDNVTSTGESGADNKLFNTTETKLIQANRNCITNLQLVPSGGFDVDTETVTITSEKNLIKLSLNGTTWVNSISFKDLEAGKLYIKADKDAVDKLVVSAENGAKFTSTSIKFVETTGVYNPSLTFDTTYIYNPLGDTNYEENYYNDKKGYYIAMQLGQNTDFTFNYNNKTAGIFNVYAQNLTNFEVVNTMNKSIATYAVDCVKAQNFSNGYSFNLSANNNNLTTVIRVDYKYYFGEKDDVVIKEDTVYLEVAVYAPINDVILEATNDEIYYVNELITDKASTSITAIINSTATKKIYFSNKEINDEINSGTNNNTGYMFNIRVSMDKYSNVESDGLLDGKFYLDLNRNTYSLTLTDNILLDSEEMREIEIDFVVEELGFTRTFTKIITVTRHTPVEGIKISGTYDNNMYLSLLSNEDKSASFTAKVTNSKATYSDLKYELYEFDELNSEENFRGKQLFSNESLEVEIDNSKHLVNLTAKAGGMFVVRIIAQDSYDDATADFSICKYVVVTVSDGSANSPYYLRTYNDVINIANEPNKYYVLASNINLSLLERPIAQDFSGNLNGVINIYDANTKTSVYSQYKFTDFNIDNGFKQEDTTGLTYNYGLFGKVSGTINNLVLDRVSFNGLTIEGGETNYTLNMGALTGVNEGTIVNSSISVLGGNIVVKNNQNKTINVGGLVGSNAGNIYYYDQENSTNKKYASTIQSAIYGDTLKIDIQSISAISTINFGGIIGKNNSTFNANYFEYENKLIRDYLTARVDLWINIDSTINSSLYSASIGGVVGYNNGALKQVSVTGEVKGNGNKLAIGGLTGTNADVLKDSASYTTNVSGLAFVESSGSVQNEINDQFVGGAVGILTGTIENVDVIFVDLRNTDFNFNKGASVNGVCVVGGLAGYVNSTKTVSNTSYAIVNGNVQSFFTTPVIVGNFAENDNFTSSKLLGGLVGLNNSKISTSFTNADMVAYDKLNDKDELHLKVYTLANGNIEDAYFIGNVKIYVDEILQQLNSAEDVFVGVFNVNSSDSIYSLVMGYNEDVTIDENTVTFEYGILTYNNSTKGFYYIDESGVGYWISGTNIFADNILSSEELDATKSSELTLTTSPWDSEPWSTNSDYIKYNNRLPVLKVNNKETMIALPEELNADVLDREFNNKVTTSKVYQNENGVFISNENNENSAIVFLSDKTYNLVSVNGETALIEKTVSPIIASGQYYVKIVSGSDKCVLSGNSIRFIKIGRIELEFVSLFNSNAKDRVVIYVENGVNGFEIVNGGKVIDKLDTQTNINKLLEFNALFNDGESSINLQNLFLEFAFVDDNGEETTIESVVLNSLGNLKSEGSTYYTFNDLQLQIKDILEASANVKLRTKLYLNLSNYIYKYDNDGKIVSTYEQVFGETSVLIDEIVLPINIYQSATELKVDTAEQKISTSKDTFIEFDIISSFIKDIDSTEIKSLDIKGRYLYASVGSVNDRETFYCVISSENEEDWLKLDGVTSLWELFDLSYTYYINDDENGYHYVFYIELKEEYKAITRNEKFEFKFVASTNNSVYDTTTITYIPQTITNLRIENFKSGVVSDLGGGEVEYYSNETHSSIIVPGKNGLIKIYVEPYYACVDVIEISSSTINVNGVSYVVEFQQMLYDTRVKHYISYPGYTTQENTLRLQKNSYIDADGNEVYTGVIYVRTVLEKLTGVSDTFEISVNAYTYERDDNGEYDKENPVINTDKTKTTTKYLQTSYNPGVTLSVSNLQKGKVEDKNVYLIEKNSTNAVVEARIYGYHVNQQPNINFNWVDDSITEEVAKYINYSVGSAVRQSDNSYIVSINITTKNLVNPVEMSISINLISEGTINTSEVQTLTFYPVDYIPSGVYLKDSGNNYSTVNVNSSIYFDFVWLSAGQELNSNAINAILFEQDEETATILDYLYTQSYSSSGMLQENYLSVGKFGTYEITADKNASKYAITALGEDTLNIIFYVRYSYEYENGKFNIKFYPTRNSNVGEYAIKYEFTLRFNVSTTEETAEPIWTAEQFRTRLTAGGNYILMDDIVLTDWVPMEATFASLDGNGKFITINNFSVSASEQIVVGLFSTISSDTIIKNLSLDISSCSTEIMLADSNIVTGDTHFGFIAGENNGIIYNSEVISRYNDNKKITVTTSSEYSYIGLFVGSNNGIITNSRVGTSYYEEIEVNSDGTTNSSGAYSTKMFTVYASGIVAGFVAENNGTISSSYFKNADLVNTSKVGVDEVNMTAGFVAINTANANIYGSYAKGKGITSTNVRGDKSGVSNTGAGSAAGFVFLNEGTIENSYSNLRVESSSFGVAGFVYENAKSGVIKQSYSASKVTSSSTNVGLAVELPFVGVDILNNLLSYGTLENCYYLELSDDSYDNNYTPVSDADLPIGLNQTNFAISDSLLNFAFVDGNYSQAIQGIWTYYATLDKNDTETYALGKTYLPEITSANQIAKSIRYVVEVENDEGETEHELRYAYGYAQGTSVNPYIIRDYIEYNKVFNYNKEQTTYNSFTGNVRLINDIDFTLTTGDTATINTTLGYTLGDKNNQTLTVVDGNGMTISGVDTKNNEASEQSSLGLFNNINYAIVKNLDIEFIDMAYTSTRAMYSGGLAGTINDSHIIGIDLIGASTTISASNFGGGLAGVITGASGIYNVTSNLSVKVGKENLFKYYQYISKDKFEKVYSSLGYNFTANDEDGDGDFDVDDRYIQYLSQLSYAGGLAGVIDFDTNGSYSDIYNLNKIAIGENSTVTVVADIAGFVAGHLSRGVSANRLKAVITNNSFVEGAYIAGGMVAEHYGKIRYSQVSYEDNSDYDKAFADYILDVSVEALNNDKNEYGTLNFVRSNTVVTDYKNIAGGFIGVNYGGYVDNSYTKANITANANYVGGFIGVNYDGVLNSVYAQNYIELSTLQSVANSDNRTDKVGGLIAYNSNKLENESFARVYKLNNYNLSTGLKADSIVVATFFDKTAIVEHYENIIAEKLLDGKKAENVTIDYLIAESKNEINSSQGTSDSYYVYYLNYGSVDQEDYTYIYYQDYIDAHINNIDENTATDAEKTERDANLKIWKNLITRSDLIDKENNIFAEKEDIRNLYNIDENQETVFTNLFLSYDMTVWDKSDSTKFFPLLKENPTVNFYEINDESDLLLMILYPDANFVLNGDIKLSSERVNYVLNIEFTGMLIGRVNDNGEAPTISGIKLSTDNSSERMTAGFFKQTGNKTNGAIINNVNFEYDYLDVSVEKEYVGLLTAEDFGSEISAVKVSGNSISTSGLGSVTNFGGLIGDSTSSSLINCTVETDMTITSNADVSNLGGLIGSASGSYENSSTMILSSNYKGTVDLTNIDNVGGFVGKTYLTSISGGKSELTAKINSSSNYHLGGIIGSQEESYVEDTNSKLIFVTDMTYTNVDSTAYYLGGVSGIINNSSETADASIDGAMATVYVQSTENVGNLIVGGIAGETINVTKIENSIGWCYGTISGSESVTFGGLVGYTTSSLICIDNCLAYIENGEYSNVTNAKGIELSANDSIIAGGLVAVIDNSGAVVSIKNSSSSGAIWPVSTNSIELTIGGIIGEWTGDATINLENYENVTNDETGEEFEYKTNITNCYTTLMVETSRFKTGTSDIYHVSAILGNIGTYTGIITTESLYYSSDYTLCFEEKNIFSSTPIDLVAQAILLTEQKKVLFVDGWETVGGGLPYRTSLSVKLGNINNGAGTILSRYTNSTNGYSLNPSRETGKIEIQNDGGYKYYYVPTGDVFALSGTFNGVILGGGAEVKYERDALGSVLVLNPNSVLSNLRVTMTDETVKNIVTSTANNKNFSFVDTNNGTIFNLTLDYYYKPNDEETATVVNGGGIVRLNNGTMLNCFNTGVLEEIVSTNSGFGGIATTNKGYIANSGFVGTLTAPAKNQNPNIAGFCYTNEGTIYNSYSAGVISSSSNSSAKYHSTFIKYNSGTIENCVYDKYANAEFDIIENTENGNILLNAVTTEELQSTGFAGLKGNWSNNPMSLEEKEIGTTFEVVNKDSYNYGYPIYLLTQYYVKSGELTAFDENKGLYTGSGTEDNPYLITHLGTMNLINGLAFNDEINSSFKLINDIDANKNKQNEAKDTGIMENWNGLGSKTKGISFTGMFTAGNRNPSVTTVNGTTTFVLNDTYVVRYINNLTGTSGLFNYVGSGATIGSLAFGNANLSDTNIGALANEVVTGEDNVIVYNVLLGVNETNAMALTGTNIGGLIGLVSGTGTLELNTINVYSIADIYGVEADKLAEFDLYSTKSSTNMGGVIGNTSDGVEVSVNGLQFSMNSNIGMHVEGTNKSTPNIDNVGGMFGNVASGSVININTVSIVEGKGVITGKTNIGGIAGVIDGGNIIFNQIDDEGNGLELNFSLGDNSVSNPADNVGGLAGKMTGGSILFNSDTKSTINITKIQAEYNAGGLVGEIVGGIVVCPQNSLSKVNIKSLQSKQNAGGIVGSMRNYVEEDNTNPAIVAGFEVNFSSENDDENPYYAKTFGGVVGKLVSGNVGAFADISSIVGGDATATELNVKVTGKIIVNNASQIGTIAGSIEPIKEDVETFANGQVKINSVNSELSVTVKYSDQVMIDEAGEKGFGGIAGFVYVSSDDNNSKITLGSIILKDNNIQADNSIENIGGLFGNLQASKLYSTLTSSDVVEVVPQSLLAVTMSLSDEENLETKIDISGLTVRGFRNVGGFAGNYKNEEILNVDTGIRQFLDMEEYEVSVNGATDSNLGYATLLLPDMDIEDINSNASNFGGLFGSYDCSIPETDEASGITTYSSTLTFIYFETTDGSITNTETGFVNKNNVLYYKSEETEEIREEFSLYGSETNQYSVNNVGGIAGVITTKGNITLNATNKAKYVGSGYEDGSQKYSELTDKKYLYADTQKSILNINYVGGIVGKVIYNPETTKAEGEETDKIIIKNSKNDSTINGFEYVGGIIGSVGYVDSRGNVDNTNAMDIDVQSLEVGGNIYGRKYLGGIAGLITTTLNWNTEIEIDNETTDYADDYKSLINIDAQISGHSYIGGVVGSIVGTDIGSKISSLNLDTKINGLLNVGGIVGKSKGNVEIKGSEYISNEDGSETKSIYGEYLIDITANSNVGGIVGYANKTKVTGFNNSLYNSHKEDLLVIINLIEYEFGPDTSVSEDESVYYMPTSVGGLIGVAENVIIEFCLVDGNITSESKRQEELSILNNYTIGKGVTDYAIGNYTDNMDESTYDSGSLNQDFYSSYETVQTGIGGLIGTCISYELEETDTGRFTQSSMNIYAPSAMNVGGAIGYYSLGDNASISLDWYSYFLADDKDVYIAGGMGVGALFGSLSSSSEITVSDTTAIERDSTTYLQRRLLEDGTYEPVWGEYVGALIGKSTSINNLKISDASNIKIDNTLGSYYGGLVGWLDGNMRGAANNISLESNLFIGDYSGYNYGAFVGLVSTDSAKDSLAVTGIHYFVFTVDTINVYNSSFKTTNESVEVDEVNSMVYLINPMTMGGNISISVSTKGFKLDYNPVIYKAQNIETSGWAKEYCMFRSIDYVVSDNNQITSRNNIYNAEYVTEVAKESDDTIKYTIYDDGDNAVLYSKYGIAELFAENITIADEEKLEKELLTQLAESYNYNYDDLFRYGLVGALEDDAYKLNHGNGSNVFVRVDNMDNLDESKILNLNIKNLENAYELGTADKLVKNYTYESFYNYRSELLFRSILQNVDENNSLSVIVDKFKDVMTSLNYYFVKGIGEKYKNSYFKYVTVFTEFNAIDLGEPVREVATDDKFAMSGNLFDIWGNVADRLITETYSITTGMWWWKKTEYYDIENLAKYYGLEQSEEAILNYLLNVYEGQFGFISDAYVRDIYLNNGTMIVKTDKVERINTKITHSNGSTEYVPILYYYYSQSRPSDYSDSEPVVINDLKMHYPRYTSYNPDNGDVLPKYQYYDGAYYISVYALDHQVTYPIKDAFEGVNMDLPYFYRAPDGLYYVAYESMVESASDDWFDVYGLDATNLVKSNELSLELGFVYDPNYTASGYEGYDYVNVSASDLCWKLVDSAEASKYSIKLGLYCLNNSEHAYNGWFYNPGYNYTHYLVPLINDDGLIYNTDSTSELVYELGDSTYYINLKEGEIYSGKDLMNYLEDYKLYADENGKVFHNETFYNNIKNGFMFKFVTKSSDGYKLNSESNEYGYFVENKAFYYYCTYGDLYFDIDSLSTSSPDTRVWEPLSSSETNTITVYTYDSSTGTFTAVKLGVLDDTTQLYYAENINCTLDKLYKYIENKWYRLTDYYVEILDDGGYAIANLMIVDPEANYAENKYKLCIDLNGNGKPDANDYYIYTRFNFTSKNLSNCADWQTFLDLIKKTNGNGYADNYKLAELAMFSFNTYEKDDSNKINQVSGFVCCDTSGSPY